MILRHKPEIQVGIVLMAKTIGIGMSARPMESTQNSMVRRMALKLSLYLLNSL